MPINNPGNFPLQEIYNGQIKTSFLSGATQPRFITFPDKSGEVALKTDLEPYVKQTVFVQNSLLAGMSVYQTNSLEIITLVELLGN